MAAAAVDGLFGTRERDRVLFGVATFFYWASLYLYVPILPVYAQSVVDSLAMVGVVISSYALPQLLLRIPIGLYYDSVTRRKPLVLVSMAMCLGGAVGLAYAGGGGTMFLARAMTGVGAAGWVAFTTFFTGYYRAHRSARAIGTINAVNQVALVVATGSGGVLADVGGYRVVFLVAAGLAVLGLLAMALAREPAVVAKSHPAGGFRGVATSPLLVASAGMAILLQFATFSSIFGFIPSYGASIGANSSQLGAITMVTLAAGAVASLASVRLAERFGYSSALGLGAALFGLSLLLVPMTVTPVTLGLVQVVGGLGRGSLSTLLMALSIRSAPPGARATAMGVYQAVYATGMLAGPIVSGLIADWLDLGAVFRLCALVTLVIAVVARHSSVRRA
jgi:MFS family permease